MKPLCARLVLALMLTSVTSQPTSAAAPDWFPRAEMMTIGAYYCREAWPENQWVLRMQKQGGVA